METGLVMLYHFIGWFWVFNSLILTWFKGTTSNDNNHPITFTLPATYTSWYSCLTQAISTSLTENATMRTYSPMVYNETLSTVIIHYYVWGSGSSVAPVQIFTIGY